MKIIREINGEQVEIELTNDEILLSHYEWERECRREDIHSQFEEMYDQELQDIIATITDEDIENMRREVEHNIDHCDAYWRAYWGCIDSVVNKYLKSRGVALDD